jgi:TATA-binding protein-associated factor Taf7
LYVTTSGAIPFACISSSRRNADGNFRNQIADFAIDDYVYVRRRKRRRRRG